MLNIKTLLDEFVSNVRGDSSFDDIKIISAYPFTVKPDFLSEKLIAVGFSDISMTNCHIGFRESAGDVKIFADIFVPVNQDSREACKIFSGLCSALKSMNIVAVSAQRICVDEKTASYVMKTEFTFRDEIALGGEGGE